MAFGNGPALPAVSWWHLRCVTGAKFWRESARYEIGAGLRLGGDLHRTLTIGSTHIRARAVVRPRLLSEVRLPR